MRIRAVLVGAVMLVLAGSGQATIIDFNSLVHGEVVNTQFAPDVTISAVNVGGGPDLAVAFDTTVTSSSGDVDLQGPGGAGNLPWFFGNIAANANLGVALIIQENDDPPPDCTGGICSDPDDEGSRPAGEFIFEFNQAINTFGIDIIDVEGPGVEDGQLTFFSGATNLGSIDFASFTGATFGNHSANSFRNITTADFGGNTWDKVIVHMGGSGGITELRFVPEPTTASLVGLGLLGMLSAARWQRHKRQ